jgi:hypothetical protein
MGMKRNRFFLAAFAFAAIFAATAVVVNAAGEPAKGKLYLMTERATLTRGAGVPCEEGENNFCYRNFKCKKGHVARGIVMKIDDPTGEPNPTGFGVTCADPNELYKTYDVGLLGEDVAGSTYREPCDVGFFLSGSEFYTTDRKKITGVKARCRRYWPVEDRDGVNTFGHGSEKQPLVCPAGSFATGVKASYFRNLDGKSNADIGFYSLRFYCAEMREYLGLPHEDPDPRTKGDYGKRAK